MSYFARPLWFAAIMALMCLLAAFGAGGVRAQDSGHLEGQVVNQTDGGAVPGGIPVTLLTFKGMSLEDTTELNTDDEGRFRFDDLDTSEDSVYQVSAQYKGVNYLTDFLVFEDDTLDPVTLAVYEPTTDGAHIHVERLHIIIDVHAHHLQVGELHVFSNTGDRTYVGDNEGDSEILRFSLPSGATNLEFQSGQLGDRYLETSDGFVDTTPVLPGVGTNQVLLSYSLDYGSPQFSFSVVNRYPVTGVNVLVSDPTVEVSSPDLQAQGFRSMQGQDWISLAAEDLPPGQEISLDFDGLPMTETEEPTAGGGRPTGSQGTLRFIALGLVLFGLGVLVGYHLPRSTEARQAARTEPSSDRLDEDDLIVALADLDDSHERGDLPLAEYEKQRAELKQRLKGQMRQ